MFSHHITKPQLFTSLKEVNLIYNAISMNLSKTTLESLLMNELSREEVGTFSNFLTKENFSKKDIVVTFGVLKAREYTRVLLEHQATVAKDPQILRFIFFANQLFEEYRKIEAPDANLIVGDGALTPGGMVDMRQKTIPHVSPY